MITKCFFAIVVVAKNQKGIVLHSIQSVLPNLAERFSSLLHCFPSSILHMNGLILCCRVGCSSLEKIRRTMDGADK